MEVSESYNRWAKSYDTNDNKTRDLDKKVTIEILNQYKFDSVLEIGSGTGKNTQWFSKKAKKVTGLDASKEMLAVARQKIKSSNVDFQLANLTKNWEVANNSFDLIASNLVLEHISDLNFIFQQSYNKLKKKGKFFICELHPFKQYSGSQARFETERGIEYLEVYTHHFSDYLSAAFQNGFNLLDCQEKFDSDREIPRLITFLFEKK